MSADGRSVFFSMNDLYPGVYPVLTTKENTQPEEAESVHYATMEDGAVITPKKQLSFLGVFVALIVVCVIFGWIK